jgi:hypothetical protein
VLSIYAWSAWIFSPALPGEIQPEHRIFFRCLIRGGIDVYSQRHRLELNIFKGGIVLNPKIV